jgi:hypothetical protein
MSARTNRPRVTGVTVDSDGCSTSGTSALSGLLSGLSAGARAAYQSIQEARVEMEQVDCTHRPLAAIHREREAQTTQAKEDLPEVEATKVETLQEASAYRVEPSSGALDAPMRSLQQASTPAEARMAQDEVMATLETEHHRLFTERLIGACKRASVEAGFPTVETQVPSDGPVRVVATNEAGHALVSEVEAAPGEEPSLATKVVGVRDGSCNEMLDAFDEALEEEGVRAATPRRTFTGGVCELAAAKDFVRSKVRKRSSAKTGSAKSESDRADQRNQRKQRSRRSRRRGRNQRQ